MTKIIEEKLFEILASNYMLSFKTQNYHWNITGPNFYNIHLLLEEQYNDLNEANDLIAERLRTMGVKIPTNIINFAEKTIIKEGNFNSDWVDMTNELALDHFNLSNFISQVINIINPEQDPTTIDILTNRMHSHLKNNWILKSHNN